MVQDPNVKDDPKHARYTESERAHNEEPVLQYVPFPDADDHGENGQRTNHDNDLLEKL